MGDDGETAGEKKGDDWGPWRFKDVVDYGSNPEPYAEDECQHTQQNIAI